MSGRVDEDGANATVDEAGAHATEQSPAGDRPDDAAGSTSTPSRRRFRALVVAIGLGLAGPVFAGALMIAAVLGLDIWSVSLSPLTGMAVTLVLTQIVGFGSVIVGYALYRDYSFETLGIRMPTVWELGMIVGGGIATLGLALIGATIMQLFAIEGANNQAAEVGAQNPEIFLLLIPASFLIIGPCEEGLYRGIVQGRLREGLGPIPSIIIAATLFAAVHVVALSGPTSARLATIALLLVPGLVLGAAYEYSGSLVVASGIHGLYDALIFGILYLVVA